MPLKKDKSYITVISEFENLKHEMLERTKSLANRVGMVERELNGGNLTKLIHESELAMRSLSAIINRSIERENSINLRADTLERIIAFMSAMGKLSFDLDMFKPDIKAEKQRIAVLEKELEVKTKKLKDIEEKLKGIM